MFAEHASTIPSDLGPYFISIIKSVMNDPPSESEMKVFK